MKYDIASGFVDPDRLSFGDHILLISILGFFPSHKNSLTIKSYCLKIGGGMATGKIIAAWFNWDATIILTLILPHI